MKLLQGVRSATIFLLLSLSVVASAQEYDLVLAGGRVMDPETNLDATRYVGITDGTIRSISQAPLTGRETIDVSGLVVAPGFIDLHAHGDPLRTPQFRNAVAMGVTTLCLGLDGSSPWRGDPATWVAKVSQRRPAVHIATFVGHGSIRRAVIGNANRPATAAERTAMAALVRDALIELRDQSE